jgi:RNA polymerase sigma factor (sigma-70 family)
MTNAPIIHIVDDDPSFRTAVGRVLTACGYRTAPYASATALLESLPNGEPGCILLDVRMSGVTGPQLQRQLAEVGCRLPIVFVTGHGDVPTSVAAIKAGAEDFLTKPVPKDKLVAAIDRALAHDAELRERDDRIDALRLLVARLTPREREVFELVVRGKLNKQIAHELGTSERTIKAHRRSIMEKCEARSIADLVLIAERLGMLAHPPAANANASTPAG